MASFGRFTTGAGGVVQTLSYTDPTLTLTQSAGTSPLTATIAGGGGVDGSGTANFVSKWSDTDTLADSLFYSDADIANTIYGGFVMGLYLDFPNSVYTLGQQGDNNTLKLNCGNNIFQLGNTDNRGLYIDLSNSIYKLGDFGYSISGTNFIVDDSVEIIKTQNGGEDRGLYVNFASNIYSLGISETGDPVGEPIAGFNANLTTAVYSMGDAGAYLSDGYIQLTNEETRLYIETNRTHLRNLTEEQIAALSAPLEGDIVYNVSSHHINYYNGTTWRKLLDGAQ